MAVITFITDGTPIKFAGETFNLGAGEYFLDDIESLFEEKLKAHSVTAEDLIRHADAQGRYKPIDASGKEMPEKDIERRYRIIVKK